MIDENCWTLFRQLRGLPSEKVTLTTTCMQCNDQIDGINGLKLITCSSFSWNSHPGIPYKCARPTTIKCSASSFIMHIWWSHVSMGVVSMQKLWTLKPWKCLLRGHKISHHTAQPSTPTRHMVQSDQLLVHFTHMKGNDDTRGTNLETLFPAIRTCRYVTVDVNVPWDSRTRCTVRKCSNTFVLYTALPTCTCVSTYRTIVSH